MLSIDRRAVWKVALIGAVTSTALVACTTGTTIDIPKTIATVINKVQEGVAKACEAAGKVVPQANSVLLVLRALMSVPTGTPIDAALITAEMIAQAVNQIVAVGCPQPSVSGRLTAGPQKTASGAEVEFY